jgi:hypothetical protein
MASNIPRLAITSLTERLRVTGFTGVDVWDDWLRNDLDTESAVAHREALLLGQSYAIVWADRFGRPQVSVESAKQVACLRDSGTRWITAAVKRWETGTTTEACPVSAGRDRPPTGPADRCKPSRIPGGGHAGQPARSGSGRALVELCSDPRRGRE